MKKRIVLLIGLLVASCFSFFPQVVFATAGYPTSNVASQYGGEVIEWIDTSKTAYTNLFWLKAGGWDSMQAGALGRDYFRIHISGFPVNAKINAITFSAYLYESNSSFGERNYLELHKVQDSGSNNFNASWWSLADQANYGLLINPYNEFQFVSGWFSTVLSPSDFSLADNYVTFSAKLHTENLGTPWLPSWTLDANATAKAPYLAISYYVPIVGSNGVFTVNGTQISYAVRLRNNATAQYLNSKSVSWKVYNNGTQYDSGSAITNSSGWLIFRAAKNLPFRNGTWSLWVSDSANETVSNAISASYYVKTSGYSVGWPSQYAFNQPFTFNVTLTSQSRINGTWINLNNIFVKLGVWWFGQVFVSNFTYGKFTAINGTRTYSNIFSNNIPEGNNTVKIWLYYADGVGNHLLDSQTKTYIVLGTSGSSQNPLPNQGTPYNPPSQPSPIQQFGQQAAQVVVENPYAQAGLIAITLIVTGIFAANRLNKMNLTVDSKWKKRQER